MDKRKIHTIIRKYNQFNSRFGDDQFNIRITPYCNGNFEDFELYSVKCGSDVELETSEVSELFDYILDELDYYENNISCDYQWYEENGLENGNTRKFFKRIINDLKILIKEN